VIFVGKDETMTVAVKPRRMSSSDRPSPELRLYLLGGFSLTVDAVEWPVAGSCRRLLVYLALQEQPQCRIVVAASLWPTRTDARACANLRSSLWRLPAPNGLSLVESVGDRLRLSADLVVDVKVAEAIGWSLVRQATPAVDRIDPILFTSELLPGWYDDWVIFERERFAQLRYQFLETYTYALVDDGRVAQALDVALRLVAADPLREGSQRALLTVYCAERNLGQARRQLDSYRRLIKETFGCESSLTLFAVMSRPSADGAASADRN
jgi:DNA-binding SARP family transcriptional activator